MLHLSTELWIELHDSGVRVLAMCPGPTETGFFATAGNDQMMQQCRSVDQMVANALRTLRRHRPYVVDRVSNTTLAEATRLMPTRWASKVAGWVASR